MSNERQRRQKIAEETVRILDAGYYDHPVAGRVSVAAEMQKAKDATFLYRPEHLYDLRTSLENVSRDRTRPTKFAVTNETTFNAVKRFVSNGSPRCLALNFASAKHPGGYFLGGAEAQEEFLARSSGLYPCLLTKPEFYNVNIAQKSNLFTDLTIYSPDVPVIRDDYGQLLDKPYCVSIITSPAPNLSNMSQDSDELKFVNTVLRRRMEFILSIAAIRQYRHLVLGAWGCGIFRNDPVEVSQMFREFLTSTFAGFFDEVVFAIVDHSPELRYIGPFQQTFLGSIDEG